MNNKSRLIEDIQNLLNSYEGIPATSINPELLDFLDEETLKSIIGSLLDQKELAKESDIKWLEQFKSKQRIISI